MDRKARIIIAFFKLRYMFHYIDPKPLPSSSDYAEHGKQVVNFCRYLAVFLVFQKCVKIISVGIFNGNRFAGHALRQCCGNEVVDVTVKHVVRRG